MVKMSREEMLEYLKQFDRKNLGKYDEATVKATVKKMEALLKKFGFEYYKSFSSYCGKPEKGDTSWFWRFKTGEYNYIEVQTGYIKPSPKKVGRGRNARYIPQPIEGLFRVTNHIAHINPATGKPFQIGETDYSNPYNPATLTRRGWYTGD